MKQLTRLSKDLPYALRIVILIIFFNGLLAFASTFLSVFAAEGFYIDLRILNILIAFGLARKHKLGYVFGIISVGDNVFIHSLRISEVSSVGGGILVYFLSALVIDIFQLYIFLRASTRVIYFAPKEQVEL